MTIRNLQVKLPGASYPICLGVGARHRLHRLLTGRDAPSRLHVVTDERVWRRYGRELGKILDSTELPVATSVVPAGESSKSPRQITRLWRDILSAGCDRSSCVVAFGGGVIGDLGGFAAASALRGIDFIQIPTTLLAMVDASVGGKTGINLPEGKNLVGSFHQPRAVVMDLDFLDTLPRREFRAGCAEVIKTAAIRDARFFRRLETNCDAIVKRDPTALRQAVEACVRIKADVVAKDEKESRLRMILNFGHTFAHALEAVSRYRVFLHGEAVAIGMVFAARFGEELGYSAAGTSARLTEMIRAYGLPIDSRVGAPATLMRAMLKDKKRGRSGLRWVFLPKIGECEIFDHVDLAEVEAQVRCFVRGRQSR